MDTNNQIAPEQIPTPNQQTVSQEEMLREIYENTRKTKNYMKWQLYITIAFVVLPIIGILAVVPMLMNTLGSVYGSGGLLQ